MKQLIGLELRSKIQLEKENKRLKDEIEKLRLKLVKVDHHDESSNEKECKYSKKTIQGWLSLRSPTQLTFQAKC